MFANLAKKDYNDMTWNKPETPDLYKVKTLFLFMAQPIKKQAHERKEQLEMLRKQ